MILIHNHIQDHPTELTKKIEAITYRGYMTSKDKDELD